MGRQEAVVAEGELHLWQDRRRQIPQPASRQEQGRPAESAGTVWHGM